MTRMLSQCSFGGVNIIMYVTFTEARRPKPGKGKYHDLHVACPKLLNITLGVTGNSGFRLFVFLLYCTNVFASLLLYVRKSSTI